MAKEYDKIIKENLEAIFLPLTKKLLNISCDYMEELPDDLQLTIERIPDFLKRVIFSDKSRNFILQIEFQTADDAEMPARMLEYHGLLYRKYSLPVFQQVFYIGTGSSKMKNKIEHPNISFSYGLMSFQEISYLDFINSEIPEEIMLAILANFEGEKAEIIITEILTKIDSLSIGTFQKKKTVRQLGVLSRLRNLQPIVDKLIHKIMALNLDIKDDTYFVKGKKEGKKEKQDRIILALLKKGKLSREEIAEVAEVTLAYVNNLAKMIE